MIILSLKPHTKLMLNKPFCHKFQHFQGWWRLGTITWELLNSPTLLCFIAKLLVGKESETITNEIMVLQNYVGPDFLFLTAFFKKFTVLNYRNCHYWLHVPHITYGTKMNLTTKKYLCTAKFWWGVKALSIMLCFSQLIIITI